MSGEEMIVAIFAILSGVSLAGFIFARITKLIRIWLEGRNGTEMVGRTNQEFLTFKHEVERRLVTLEAIVTEEKGPLLDISENQHLSAEDEVRHLSNLLKNKQS